MKKINYYVIGGQYEFFCHGGTPTLLGAKRLARKCQEYWDNWAGWHTPDIYAAEDSIGVCMPVWVIRHWRYSIWVMFRVPRRATACQGLNGHVPRQGWHGFAQCLRGFCTIFTFCATPISLL